jgi:hypothetical protein
VKVKTKDSNGEESSTWHSTKLFPADLRHEDVTDLAQAHLVLHAEPLCALTAAKQVADIVKEDEQGGQIIGACCAEELHVGLHHSVTTKTHTHR